MRKYLRHKLSGRIGRLSFLVNLLTTIIFGIVFLMLVGGISHYYVDTVQLTILENIVALFSGIVVLAIIFLLIVQLSSVTCKRINDIGWPKKLAIVAFVPYIQWVLFIVLAVRRSKFEPFTGAPRMAGMAKKSNLRS